MLTPLPNPSATATDKLIRKLIVLATLLATAAL